VEAKVHASEPDTDIGLWQSGGGSLPCSQLSRAEKAGRPVIIADDIIADDIMANDIKAGDIRKSKGEPEARHFISQTNAQSRNPVPGQSGAPPGREVTSWTF
jgi:hypothetical protein